MLPTSQFNDQFFLNTTKICDKWTNGVLPPKFAAVQVVCA
jgi:hypothetical protein